jgi:hypothetical protein
MSSGIQRRIVYWKSTDISEEHVAPILRVEEYAKQGTCMKLHFDKSQNTELLNVFYVWLW